MTEARKRRGWGQVGLATGLGALVVSAVWTAPLLGGAQSTNTEAKAELVNGQGAPVGTVTLVKEYGKVKVTASARGLPAGFHGFHIHTVGKCEGPTFTSAGGHLNPGGGGHPNHAGDMPPLFVNGDGTAVAYLKTDRFKVGPANVGSAMATLLDEDGSAVMIHANPDNQANIPTDRYDPDPDKTTLDTGDAGARIACGVVTARRSPSGDR